MIPSESFGGAALYKVLKYYEWSKIALFYSSDTLGTDAYTTFQYFCSIDEECQIEYLNIASYPTTQLHLTSIIRAAADKGATIFVLLMSDLPAARFLVQAHDLGVLKKGTQVLGMALSSSLDPLYTVGATKDTVSKIMEGYITISLFPSLYYQLPEGKTFLEVFRSLPPSKTVNSDGSITCNNQKDDSGADDSYLYKYVSFNPDLVPTTCLGIESFAKYAADGSDLDPRILYTYASVVAYAYAAHLAVQMEIDYIDATEMSYIFSDTFLTGGGYRTIVGNLSFFAGIEDKAWFGRGDRFTGNAYQVLNFNPTQYALTGESMSLVGIIDGSYSTSDRMFSCEDITTYGLPYSIDCISAVYRDSLYPPTDYREDIYESVPLSMSVSFIFFGCLVIVLTIISTAYITYYRDSKTIINAQYQVLLVRNAAFLLGGIRVILSGVDVTINTCIVELWLEHITFRLLFATVVLKLWRIDKLINTTGIKRVKITQNDLLFYIFCHFVAIVLGLIIVSGLMNEEVSYYKTTNANQSTYEAYCPKDTLDNAAGGVLLAIYASEMGYLFAGLYYLYITRNVPPIVNETKVLFPVTSITILVIAVVVICVFALKLTPVQSDVAVGVGFIIILIFSLSIYTIHKYILLKKEWAKKYQPKQAVKVVASGKITSTITKGTIPDPDVQMAMALESVRAFGTSVDQCKYVQQNIDTWRAILLKLAEEEDSNALKPSTVAPLVDVGNIVMSPKNV